MSAADRSAAQEPAYRRRVPGRAGLVCSILFVSLAAQLALATIPDTLGDSTVYQRWARYVSHHGIVDAYFGAYRTPLRYLPVIPYVMGGLGAAERTWPFRHNVEAGKPIPVLVKLPAIFANLAISLALVLWLARGAGFRAAFLAMTAYALNPGVLFDTAYWGQTDSIHALFVFLSVLLLYKRQPELAWTAIALAIFTKPQAWPFAPAVLLLTVRDYTWRRVFTSFAAAALVTAVILLPFAREGRLEDLFWKVYSYSSLRKLSTNAHNIWWLTTLGPPSVPASTAILPGLTLQLISSLISLAVYAFSLVKIWHAETEHAALMMLAYVGLAFFMLAPGMHENYLFTMFPFLAAACAGNRRLWVPFAILSATFLLNMMLHDPFIMISYFYGHPFEQVYESSGLFYESKVFMSPSHRALTLANAAVGVGTFAYLSWWILGAGRGARRELLDPSAVTAAGRAPL